MTKKAPKQLWIIEWHKDQRDCPRYYWGTDIVYASSKREASEMYHREHYSPIDRMYTTRDPNGKYIIESLDPEELQRIINGEVFTFDEGT